MITLIGMCAFLTVTLFAVAIGRQLSAPRARLRARVEMVARGQYSPLPDFHSRRLLRMQNYSALPLLRGLLQRSARAERIADDLERAAIPLRVGEYLVLRVGVGLLFALGARALIPTESTRLAVMVLAFLLGMLVPRWYVMMRIRRRRAQVEALLPDALDMISRSLRTGSGLLQSIESVIEQIEGAISDEFGRARQSIAAGLSAEEAFRELDQRVKSKDLHIVVTAVQIQREVGGNLAEILDNVAATMRERIRLRNDMKALSSRQRLSAYLIASVPIFIVVVLWSTANEALRPLFDTEGGRLLLGIAAALELAGMVTMHRLASSFEV
jgi:tight adherence protein B